MYKEPVVIRRSRKPPTESKGEHECRRVLEYLFGMEFPKTRPSFLKNSVTGRNLELDCSNEYLKLAVEYQGIQHREYSPFFHKTKEAFWNQKYRDDMTRRLCEENGWTLIEVPDTLETGEIEQYLRRKLTENGFKY
jgi:hypothetical protein